jgi:thioredoxin 1
VLDALAERHGDRVQIAKVDVGENPALATRFSVQAVPTLILFSGGEPVERVTGLVGPPELEQMIRKHAAGATTGN